MKNCKESNAIIDGVMSCIEKTTADEIVSQMHELPNLLFGPHAGTSSGIGIRGDGSKMFVLFIKTENEIFLNELYLDGSLRSWTLNSNRSIRREGVDPRALASSIITVASAFGLYSDDIAQFIDVWVRCVERRRETN